MNEEINLNGKTYILKDSLELNNYWIMDNLCVLAIVPMKRNINIDDKIENHLGTFKKYDGRIDFIDIDKITLKSEVFRLSKTKFSTEFLKIAQRTARAFGKQNNYEFYLLNENDKIKEHSPCLIVFGDLVFCLAPRVDTEEAHNEN